MLTSVLQESQGSTTYDFINFYVQRFKFIDFMVIEEEEEEEDDENMDKMCKLFFLILCTYYITTQPIFVYWLSFTLSSP